MSRKTKSDPTRVSFRLDAELAAELAQKAHEAGKSTGRYARELVASGLFRLDEQEQDQRMLRVEVACLPKVLNLIQSLRTDFATSVAVLLVNAGKLSPEQARRWVKQTLLQSTSQEDQQSCSRSD